MKELEFRIPKEDGDNSWGLTTPFTPKSAYLRLLRGDLVLLSSIMEETPYVAPAINVMTLSGEIVGQHIMFSDKEDAVLIYLGKPNGKNL